MEQEQFASLIASLQVIADLLRMLSAVLLFGIGVKLGDDVIPVFKKIFFSRK